MGTPRALGRGWALPAGLAAGALGGAFATGGPPVIAYGTARGLPPFVFKGGLQAFFACTTAAHLVLLAGAGILTQDVALDGALLMPLVPLGTWLGGRYGDRLAPALFRRLVLAALLALGLSYVVGGR